MIEERAELPRPANNSSLAVGVLENEELAYYPKGTIAVKRLRIVGGELNYILP